MLRGAGPVIRAAVAAAAAAAAACCACAALAAVLALLSLGLICFPSLSLAVLCFPLLVLACPSREASGASPAGLAIPSFLWLSLGFPCFFPAFSRYPLLSLASLVCMFSGTFFFVVSLAFSLSIAFPCFLLPSLAFSCLTLCSSILIKIALPVPC